MPTKKTASKAAVKKTVRKKPTTKKTSKSSAKKAVTKKPIKKVVAKKASAKSKKNASAKGAKIKPNLPKAADHESFWVTSGTILNDLVSLAAALDTMEKKVFSYHVSKDKNDFADWVDVVLADKACATALRTCKTPKSAQSVVVKHLKLYNV